MIPSNGYSTYTTPLDLQLVQSWINNPSLNYGYVLQTDAINIHIGIVPPQRPDVSKRPLLSITYIMPNGISENENIPVEYNLEQNYPNPFNPTTQINYSIPKSSFVKLVVYDMLSREIETLVSGGMKAGNYKADWNAAKYPSGVYFYRLTADNFTAVRKMILVK